RHVDARTQMRERAVVVDLLGALLVAEDEEGGEDGEVQAPGGLGLPVFRRLDGLWSRAAFARRHARFRRRHQAATLVRAQMWAARASRRRWARALISSLLPSVSAAST